MKFNQYIAVSEMLISKLFSLMIVCLICLAGYLTSLNMGQEGNGFCYWMDEDVCGMTPESK